MVWVLDYLEDLDADFLRFYRIDGFDSMDSQRFFSLALRVPFYDGVLTARIEAQREEEKQHNPSQALRDGTAAEVPLESFSEFIEMR